MLRESRKQTEMKSNHLPQISSRNGNSAGSAFATEELPLTVREAALYLGVSVQTIYVWIEGRRIPHLRVMGRNIRFLKSDLESFRARFRQEVANAMAQSMP